MRSASERGNTMRRKGWFVVVTIWLAALFLVPGAQAASGDGIAMEAEASFRSIVLRVSGAEKGDVVKTYWKPAAESGFTAGHQVAADESGLTAAGFANLSEGKKYTVRAEVFRGIEQVFAQEKTLTTGSSSKSDGVTDILPPISDMKLTPLFETVSVYVPYALTGAACRVRYREKTDISQLCNVYFFKGGQWRDAYPPVYHAEAKQFAGSLVDLKENTEYEVLAEITVNGVKVREFRQNVTTWGQEPQVAREIDLSEIYSSRGELALMGLRGTADGWIKITDMQGLGVSADHENDQQAVLILDCAYVWLDGVRIQGGKFHGVHLTGNSGNIRVSGCDISGWGRDGEFAENAGKYDVGYVDRDGNRINNDAGICLTDVTNTVIEKNYIHDSNTRTNAWAGTAEIGGEPVTWDDVHPGGASGIFVRNRGGLVIRYNDIVGSQEHRFNDAIEGLGNSSRFGGLAKDADVYGNTLAYCQDDGIEMDGGAVNVRVFENRIEETYSGISTAPNRLGPSYVYRNVVHNLQDEFGHNSSGVKAGGGTAYCQGTTFYFYNTFVSNTGFADPAFGIHAVGYGNDDDRKLYRAVTRNNLFYNSWSGRTAIDEKVPAEGNSFDYDLAGNTAVTPDHGGVFSLLSPNEKEEHGILALPQFENLSGSDYRLKEASPGYGDACTVPGFSGADMGALQKGETGCIPARPFRGAAEAYTLILRRGESAQLGIRGGAGQAYRIQRSGDFSCVDTEKTGTLDSGGAGSVRITAGTPAGGSYDGMILIRFSDGFSIPVNIRVKQ